MCQHPLWGETVKLPYMRELVSRKKCWGSKTTSKCSNSEQKNCTIEQWNKIVWTDKFKLEIFRSKRKVYVRWRVCNWAATPYFSLTSKYSEVFVMVCVVGSFCHWQNRALTLGVVLIESDRLSKNTAASLEPIWNASCGSRICNRTR